MDPTLMEFYIGELETAVSAHAEIACPVLDAARAVIAAWNEVTK